MTDTTTLEASAASGQSPRRSGSLTAMRLAELQGLASSMGISGTTKMRKGDLVAAIKSRQNGDSGPAATSEAASSAPAQGRSRRASSSGQVTPKSETPKSETPKVSTESSTASEDGSERVERPERVERAERTDRAERNDRTDRTDRADRAERIDRADRTDRTERTDTSEAPAEARNGQNREQRDSGREQRDRTNDRATDRNQGQAAKQQGQDQGPNQGGQDQGNDDDETGRSGRRRRNRNRSRDRDKRRPVTAGGETQVENEPQITEDDVLVPVAGILDILDNYAFVRTSGYLPGNNDVYVPLGMVKRHNLRKGDAVVGATKAPRDGEDPQQQTVGTRNNRAKYTPLARLDTVNGQNPDDARARVEFGKLTPLYPQDRLRLETEPGILTTRIIDLVAPIGKGQRGLIVAPAKAGKTMVMQAIANAITTNNPEVHLMVVLVDERPEEVTDMQRAVKGEVIASTFDRPAEDHTTVAELAIERAKRLVEMGHDVVVLLDSITKLGRAYNLAAPASGRILSGGVDSAALYPPKKFFGAARNIEDGGSLTILATALVETGSRMDEVIFEEFKGTGNMELKLDRGLSNRRIFPAVDINNSGTRREEILLAPEELKIMWKLRRVLAALDSQQAIELLLDRLRKSKTNYEFLLQVQQNSSIKLDDEDKD
ncbi:transcription termination factor Rho [Janibacter sp. HTCC2649]|uniref:transcription termination factor Rho n=1 Tax=Janibacter sp. HTCC2649 TaxID=313589 RepID=UPI0002FC1F39|nr:transcription termination factor Rho [Janibacter sp. HTCC2649]